MAAIISNAREKVCFLLSETIFKGLSKLFRRWLAGVVLENLVYGLFTLYCVLFYAFMKVNSISIIFNFFQPLEAMMAVSGSTQSSDLINALALGNISLRCLIVNGELVLLS